LSRKRKGVNQSGSIRLAARVPEKKGKKGATLRRKKKEGRLSKYLSRTRKEFGTSGTVAVGSLLNQGGRLVREEDNSTL